MRRGVIFIAQNLKCPIEVSFLGGIRRALNIPASREHALIWMSSSDREYRHNHYVPIWYQRRFMLPEQDRYFRLDLKPDIVNNGKARHTRRALHEWSPNRIFAENDLYTTQWGSITNTEIEKFFFGQLDSEGPRVRRVFADAGAAAHSLRW
jgi:hypothetical protein